MFSSKTNVPPKVVIVIVPEFETVPVLAETELKTAVPAFVNVPVLAMTATGAVRVYAAALVIEVPVALVKVPVKVILEVVVQVTVPLRVISVAAVTAQVIAPLPENVNILYNKFIVKILFDVYEKFDFIWNIIGIYKEYIL